MIKFLLKSRPIFLNHLLWSELEIDSLKIFLTSQKIEQLLIQNVRAKFIPQLLNFPHPIGFTRSATYQDFKHLSIFPIKSLENANSFVPTTNLPTRVQKASRRDKGKKEYRAEECGGNNGDGKVIRWPLNAIKPAVAR